MKKYHIPADLRIKINYLRRLGCQIHNDYPGGFIVIDCPYRPEDGPDSQGIILTEDEIDEAIEYAEERNPVIATASKLQLKLF